MSRLLQALKNLESRQPEAKSSAPAAIEPKAIEQKAIEQQPGEFAMAGATRGGQGLLAHLADRPHTPSPDPAPAAQPAARPTPIEAPGGKNPLARLSAGVPAAWLAGPPEELLTALESLPELAQEAAAWARPAEAPPAAAKVAPPAAKPALLVNEPAAPTAKPSEPTEPAARLAERPRSTALDKLSERWPVSEPLPALPAATHETAKASQPATPPSPAPSASPVEPPARLTPAPPVSAFASLAHNRPAAASTAEPAAVSVTNVAEPIASAPASIALAPATLTPPSVVTLTSEPADWLNATTPAAERSRENVDAPDSTLSSAPVVVPSPAPLTLLERTTRRTLSDPQRSEPYRQVAERIVRDLAHVAGRSAVLAGVGSASDTSELAFVAAAALESAGGSVLVIDGDTAHRSLTTQLDLSDAPGLSELLKLREEPARYIRKLSVGGLSFLPIGKARFPDPEPIASQLAALVQSLEAEYSLVLIDGGRTSEQAAATLARLADATYFVIRLGHTEASVAQNALRDFRAAGARVLGCVATS